MDEYSQDLESRLKIGNRARALTEMFDDYADGGGHPHHIEYNLKLIRLFLHRRMPERRALFKGTLLDSTDCLTFATLANLLATRRGIDTRIVRPDDITRYFHAMLTFKTEEGNDRVFKVTGSSREYKWVSLTPEEVVNKLSYMRPVVNFVNWLRGNPILPENYVARFEMTHKSSSDVSQRYSIPI